MTANDAAGQCQIPRSALREDRPFRYLFSGYLRNEQEKLVQITDMASLSEPLDKEGVPDLLLAKAARLGLKLHLNSASSFVQLCPLLPVPRPSKDDRRPLLAWTVQVSFVCHDVKYSGEADGVFAWPTEPSGSTLHDMLAVLVCDDLATRDGQPDGHKYSELLSSRVMPSQRPPDTYL